MTRLSPLLRRALALALLAGLLVIVWDVVVRPVAASFARLEEDRRIALEFLDRLERRVRYHETFAARVAELEARFAQSDLHLHAETAALAGADLQRRVDRLAAQAGAVVVSMQPLSPQPEAGFLKVMLRIDMQASAEALTRLLHALETGRPSVFVDRLRIASREARRGLSAVALTVEMEISAYLVGEASG